MTQRGPQHVLAYTDGSPAVVRTAQELAGGASVRLTVAAVAVIEAEQAHCCDLRSGVWNRMQRELADEHLENARATLGPVPAAYVVLEGSSVASALLEFIAQGECDLLVLPDERRRLAPWSRGVSDRLASRTSVVIETPLSSSRRCEAARW